MITSRIRLAAFVALTGVAQFTAALTFNLPGDLTLPVPLEPEAEVDAPGDGLVHIAGSATKGPIANATVSVYELDDTGFPLGSPVATTTTDDSGSFSLALSDFTEILLVETSGGSFLDESDTRPLAQRRRIQLGNGEGFMSIIEPGQATVAITPFTDALVERARIGGRLGGFDDLMISIIDHSTDGFGFSLFTTEPADPASPGGATGGALTYAYLLGTTANIVNVASLKMGMATPTYDVIKAVIMDFSDGDLDGLLDGSPIMVGSRTLPFVDFDQQRIRFRNNNYASYANATVPDWPDADIALGLRIPRTFFGTKGGTNQPLRFGIPAFAWGKVVLNEDGTGTFTDGRGVGQFEWAGAGENLVLDFTAFGSYESGIYDSFTFDTVTFENQPLEVVYTIDRIEMFIGQNDNGEERLFVTEERRTRVTNTVTGNVDEFAFEAGAQVRAFEPANALSFNDPATYEFDPALPAFNTGALALGRLGGIEGLDVDRMQFNADGTGNTVYENELFTWQVAADGHLRVDFNNGETADYYLLYDDDPELGSYVAADYTREGRVFHYGNTVFSRDPALSFTSDLVTGAWLAPGVAQLNDGSFIDDSGIWRQFPDGTGIAEFPLVDPENGHTIITPSQFRICWAIDSQGIFERKRILTLNNQFGKGRMITPEACQTIDDGLVDYRRTHELYQLDGNRLETVLRYWEDDCFRFGGFGQQGCGPTIYNLIIEPAIYEKIEEYSGRPPLTESDFAVTSPDVPVSIDPLSNDHVQDFQIDASTVEITHGPFELRQSANGNQLIPDGSLEVDPVTGVITFTPEPGNQNTRFVRFNYRVADTDGNLSNISLSTISVESGAARIKAAPVIEPTPFQEAR